MAWRAYHYGIKTFITAAFIAISTDAGATADFNSTGIAYDNPANLNQVEQNELTSGISVININFKSKGQGRQPSNRSSQPQGSAESDQMDGLPYARYAHRLTSNWVADFEVTHPWYFAQQFPNDGFTRYVPTKLKVRSVEYALKSSYQLTKRLALGAGLGYTQLHNITGGVFAGGSSGSPNDIPYEFDGRGNYMHWNVGLNLKLTPRTIFDASYFSQQFFNPTGLVEMNGVTRSAQMHTDEPDIAQFKLTQFITRNWMMAGGVTWQGWETRNSISIPLVPSQTGGRNEIVVSPLWNDSFTYSLFSNYKLSDTAEIFGSAVRDNSPYPPTTFSLGLPLPDVWYFEGGVKLHLADSLELRGSAGHGFGKRNLDTPDSNKNRETGEFNGYVNIWKLRLTYNFSNKLFQ